MARKSGPKSRPGPKIGLQIEFWTANGEVILDCNNFVNPNDKIEPNIIYINAQHKKLRVENQGSASSFSINASFVQGHDELNN